ncbi:acyl carrier protein [Burkholderia sp. 22PA0106]|uniref:acyl carrier protein n=1 Tax=Burkholderia sp. 22PA0106 TaxID=3237371 RepID=UPI0039C07FA6
MQSSIVRWDLPGVHHRVSTRAMLHGQQYQKYLKEGNAMQLYFESLRPQIAKALDIDPANLELTTMLSGNEKWDSFAILSVVALVTEHTGKQLTLPDVAKLGTVSDLVGLVQKLKGN